MKSAGVALQKTAKRNIVLHTAKFSNIFVVTELFITGR